MQVEVTDRFSAKQGRSTGRWVLQAGGSRLVVYLKRHYQLPWWLGLLTSLPGLRNIPARMLAFGPGRVRLRDLSPPP